MEIKQTNNIKADKLNCLIYGDSSVGKTTISSTLGGKTIIISAESGLLSLKGFDIDYIEVKTLGELKTALVDLAKSDYDNIFIDSLTEISSMILGHAKQEYPDDKQVLKMYGAVLERTLGFVRACINIDKNIFITALQKTTIDDMNRRTFLPDLVGSAANKIAGFFDFVFHMRVVNDDGEMKRILVTETTDYAVAKDRSGTLDKIEKPNLSDIINKVFK